MVHNLAEQAAIDYKFFLNLNVLNQSGFTLCCFGGCVDYKWYCCEFLANLHSSISVGCYSLEVEQVHDA
jgi:hypothetical protein